MATLDVIELFAGIGVQAQALDKLSRYIRNWDFMSAKERNGIMPGYSKSKGLAELKIKLAKLQAIIKALSQKTQS